MSELAKMVLQLQATLKSTRRASSPVSSIATAPSRPSTPKCKLLELHAQSSDETLSPRDSAEDDDLVDFGSVFKHPFSEPVVKKTRSVSHTPTLAITKQDTIFNPFIDSLCIKISKALWTKDLQEFIVEGGLSVLDFEGVYEKMQKLTESLGGRCVMNVTNAEYRPCWVIVSRP